MIFEGINLSVLILRSLVTGFDTKVWHKSWHPCRFAMVLQQTVLLCAFVLSRAEFSLDEINLVHYDFQWDTDNPVSQSSLSNSDETSKDEGFSIVRLSSKFKQEFVCKIPDLDLVLLNISGSNQVFPDDFTSTKVIETVRKAGFVERPCLIKTVGWWTYEMCFGDQVKQYHLEGDVIDGGAISLGYFEKDFNWDNFIKERRLKPPTSKPQTLSHAQYFNNGTKCEIKRGLRKTEVKFFCDEDLSVENAYINRVDEPSTCQYLLEVYVGSLCKLPQFSPVDKPKTPHPILCQPLLDDKKHAAFMSKKFGGNSDNKLPEDASVYEDTAVDSLPTAKPMAEEEELKPADRTLQDEVWDKLIQEPADGNLFRYMFFYFIKDIPHDLSEDDVIKAASPNFEAKNYRTEVVTDDVKYDAMEDLLLYRARRLLLVSKRRAFLRRQAEKERSIYPEKNLLGIFNEMLYIPGDVDVFQMHRLTDKLHAAGYYNLLDDLRLYYEQREIEKVNNPNVLEPEEHTQKELSVARAKGSLGHAGHAEVPITLRLKARQEFGPSWRQKYFAPHENPQGQRLKKIDNNGNVYFATVPKNPLKPRVHSVQYNGDILGDIKALLETNQTASAKLVDRIWDVWLAQENEAEKGKGSAEEDIEDKFWALFMMDSDDKGNSALRRSFLENLRTLYELQADPLGADLNPSNIDFALPWSDEEFESKKDLLIYWVRSRVLSSRKQKSLDRQRAKKGIDVSAKKLDERQNQKFSIGFEKLNAQVSAIKPETHLIHNLERLDEKRKKQVEDALNEVKRLQASFNYDSFYLLPRERLADMERNEIRKTKDGKYEANDVIMPEVHRYTQYSGLWEGHLKDMQVVPKMSLVEFALNNRWAVVKKYGIQKWKQVYFTTENCPQCFRPPNKIASAPKNVVSSKDMTPEDAIWERLMEEPAGGNTYRYQFFYFMRNILDISEEQVLKAAHTNFEAKNIRNAPRGEPPYHSMGYDPYYDIMEDFLLYDARQLLLVSKRRKTLRKEVEAKGLKYHDQLQTWTTMMEMLPLSGNKYEQEEVMDECIELYNRAKKYREKLADEQREIEKKNNNSIVEPVRYTEREKAVYKKKLDDGKLGPYTELNEVIYDLRFEYRKVYGPKWREIYFRPGECPQISRFLKITPDGRYYNSTVPLDMLDFEPLFEFDGVYKYSAQYISDEIRQLVDKNLPASAQLIRRIWWTFDLQQKRAAMDYPQYEDLEDKFWEVFMMDSDDKGNSAFRRSFLENLETLKQLQRDPINGYLNYPPSVDFALPWSDEEYESKEDLLIYWVRTYLLATKRQKRRDRVFVKKGIDVTKQKEEENEKHAYDRAKEDFVMSMDTFGFGDAEDEYYADWDWDDEKIYSKFKYERFYVLPVKILAALERQDMKKKGRAEYSKEPAGYTEHELDSYRKYWRGYDMWHDGRDRLYLDETAFNSRLNAVNKYGRARWKKIYFAKVESPQSYRPVNRSPVSAIDVRANETLYPNVFDKVLASMYEDKAKESVKKRQELVAYIEELRKEKERTAKPLYGKKPKRILKQNLKKNQHDLHRTIEDKIWDKLMEEPEGGNMFRYMFLYYTYNKFNLTDEQLDNAAKDDFKTKSIRDEMYTDDKDYDVREDFLLYDMRLILMASKRIRNLRKEGTLRKEQPSYTRLWRDIFNNAPMRLTDIHDRMDEIENNLDDEYTLNLAYEQQRIEKSLDPSVLEPRKVSKAELLAYQGATINRKKDVPADLVEFAIQSRLEHRELVGPDWRRQYLNNHFPQAERFKHTLDDGSVEYSTVPLFWHDKDLVALDVVIHDNEPTYATSYVVAEIKNCIYFNQPAQQQLIDKIWYIFNRQEDLAEQGKEYPGGDDLELKFWNLFIAGTTTPFRRSFLENLHTLEELEKEPVDGVDKKTARVNFVLPWSDYQYVAYEELLIFWVRRRVLATKSQKLLDRTWANKGINVRMKKNEEIKQQTYHKAFAASDEPDPVTGLEAVQKDKLFQEQMRKQWALGKVEEWKQTLQEYRKEFFGKYDQYYQLPRDKLAELARLQILEEGGTDAQIEPLDYTQAEISAYITHDVAMGTFFITGPDLVPMDELVLDWRLESVKRHQANWKNIHFKPLEVPQAFAKPPGMEPLSDEEWKLVSQIRKSQAKQDIPKLPQEEPSFLKQAAKDKIDVPVDLQKSLMFTPEAAPTASNPPAYPIKSRPEKQKDPVDEELLKEIDWMIHAADTNLENKINKLKPQVLDKLKAAGFDVKNLDFLKLTSMTESERQVYSTLLKIRRESSENFKESARHDKHEASYSFTVDDAEHDD